MSRFKVDEDAKSVQKIVFFFGNQYNQKVIRENNQVKNLVF